MKQHVITTLQGETGLKIEKITVLVSGGRLYHATGEDEIKVGNRSDIIGWGPLDGPAYDCSPSGAWTVMIPARELTRIGVAT